MIFRVSEVELKSAVMSGRDSLFLVLGTSRMSSRIRQYDLRACPEVMRSFLSFTIARRTINSTYLLSIRARIRGTKTLRKVLTGLQSISFSSWTLVIVQLNFEIDCKQVRMMSVKYRGDPADVFVVDHAT
jgi:spore cortex formation protein SpoVR/YcgB (stage V sporulation)